MKILAVASECAPFVKTGGLADVVGALATVLGSQDVECRVLLPLYRSIAGLAENATPVLELPSRFGGPVRVLATTKAGVDLLLVDAPHLFDRAGPIYLNDHGVDWHDNHMRFGLLSWLGAQIAQNGIGDWRPDLVHAHDWQAALVPIYLRQMGNMSAPVVITIHNIAFQGIFPASAMGALELDPRGFQQDGFEYYGQISFLKGGLMASDRITTVSPTYARELLTPEFGMGLEGVLNARKEVLTGILNGIDTQAWDPETDSALVENYSARTLAKKAVNRQALIDKFGLVDDPGKPLLSVVSRLSDQKGLDIALQALPEALAKGARFVLLGSGSPELERSFQDLAARYPDQVGVLIGFHEDLAHLIQAGADAILIPSRFEPCGLTQLCAMHYGTLPVVSTTGGLADTVIDANQAAIAAGCATGIQFSPVTVEKMRDALDRTMELFADSPAWQKTMRNAMKHPVGWETSSEKVISLYRELIER